ncbi:MAG: chromate transporter [Oscillospiraceae bacterium]
MILVRLFYEFFKTGLFAVGGGMATLPFLYDMSDATGWFTHAQLANMLAVSESTPGPLGVNMATYVGFTTAGLPGALIATLGLITPSVVVILLVAAFLNSFRHNRFVDAAFYGLRPASAGLIAAAGCTVLSVALLRVELWQATGALLDLVNLPALALAAVLLVLTRWVKCTRGLHPIVFILVSAVLGVVCKF